MKEKKISVETLNSKELYTLLTNIDSVFNRTITYVRLLRRGQSYTYFVEKEATRRDDLLASIEMMDEMEEWLQTQSAALNLIMEGNKQEITESITATSGKIH